MYVCVCLYIRIIMCVTHVYVYSLIFRPPNLISVKTQSLGECNVNKALNWTRTHAHLPPLQWDHMHAQRSCYIVFSRPDFVSLLTLFALRDEVKLLRITEPVRLKFITEYY